MAPPMGAAGPMPACICVPSPLGASGAQMPPCCKQLRTEKQKRKRRYREEKPRKEESDQSQKGNTDQIQRGEKDTGSEEKRVQTEESDQTDRKKMEGSEREGEVEKRLVMEKLEN